MRMKQLFVKLVAMVLILSMSWAVFAETIDFSSMTREELEEITASAEKELKENHTIDDAGKSAVKEEVTCIVDQYFSNQGITVSWPWWDWDYEYSRDWGYYTLDTEINYKDSQGKRQKEGIHAGVYRGESITEVAYLEIGDKVIIDNRPYIQDDRVLRMMGIAVDLSEEETKQEYRAASAPSFVVGITDEDEATPMPVVATSPTPTPIPMPVYATLARGSKGQSVKDLQKKLIDQGYLSGTADGNYGKMTEAAVSSFQRSVGIKVTGKADSWTQQILLTLPGSARFVIDTFLMQYHMPGCILTQDVNREHFEYTPSGSEKLQKAGYTPCKGCAPHLQAATPSPALKITPMPKPTPTTEPDWNETDYILNRNTKKFHYPWCSSVNQMKEKNKRYFTGTREEVIRQGYSSCGRCNP